jgi:hypothetical protein
MPSSRHPERIKPARARAPVYAAFAFLAVGLTGAFAPSRAGMPTLARADDVEPSGARVLGAPRAEIANLNQGGSAQPGEAGISGARQAGMPTPNQKDSVKPRDAGIPSASRDYPSPAAHRPHKVVHARQQLKKPPRIGNSTTQLNQQEMVRHQASSQSQRDPVSAFFAKLFQQ